MFKSDLKFSELKIGGSGMLTKPLDKIIIVGAHITTEEASEMTMTPTLYCHAIDNNM